MVIATKLQISLKPATTVSEMIIENHYKLIWTNQSNILLMKFFVFDVQYFICTCMLCSVRQELAYQEASQQRDLQKNFQSTAEVRHVL